MPCVRIQVDRIDTRAQAELIVSHYPNASLVVKPYSSRISSRIPLLMPLGQLEGRSEYLWLEISLVFNVIISIFHHGHPILQFRTAYQMACRWYTRTIDVCLTSLLDRTPLPSDQGYTSIIETTGHLQKRSPLSAPIGTYSRSNVRRMLFTRTTRW